MNETSESSLRFTAARNKVITLDERERVGIGMQKEKTLHAILKNYMDPDPSHHEIPASFILPGQGVKFIADIFDGEQVTEIQTSGFSKLNDRLRFYLPQVPVTVVFPIPYCKWVVWIDPETGELLKKNKSPVRGTAYQAFREFYQIRNVLQDEALRQSLSFRLILLDIEEYRLKDGWSRDGKRGSHRFDYVPLAIHEEIILNEPADFGIFLPEGLPETFTAKDLQAATGVRRRSVSFSQVLSVLTMLGLTERTGVGKNRAYLYKKANT